MFIQSMIGLIINIILIINPIYDWINNQYNIVPKWNFYKFLFDRSGKLVDSWSSITKPNKNKIKDKINNLI